MPDISVDIMLIMVADGNGVYATLVLSGDLLHCFKMDERDLDSPA